jgi:hypothetical protein
MKASIGQKRQNNLSFKKDPTKVRAAKPKMVKENAVIIKVPESMDKAAKSPTNKGIRTLAGQIRHQASENSLGTQPKPTISGKKDT